MAGRHRRDRGAGSLGRPRPDGKIPVSFPLLDGTGRRRYYTARDRADAQRWLKDMARQSEAGALSGGGRQKLSAYLAEWLDTKRALGRAPSTVLTYGHLIAKHIDPELGALPLDKLTPQRLQRAVNGWSATLSPRTVALMANSVLKAALKRAVRFHLLPHNPAEYLELPPPRRGKAGRALSPSEVGKFLAVIEGHPREALYRTLLATGLRIGEVLGLPWSALDFRRAVLVARQQQRDGYHGHELAEVKTEAGVRTLPLPPSLVTALRAHLAGQLAEREVWGARWRDYDLVFPGQYGGMLSDSTVRVELSALSRRAGLGHLTPHDLRRTYATVLAAAGVQPTILKELLGHHSYAISDRFYARVTDDTKRAAVGPLEVLLGGTNDPSLER